MSWLIQRDVDEGRSRLNFSEWGQTGSRRERRPGEMGQKVLEGEMPPAQYTLIHPDARLSSAEKQALADGLQATQ
jgi:hypothetical protein